jgi:hypothetical protein
MNWMGVSFTSTNRDSYSCTKHIITLRSHRAYNKAGAASLKVLKHFIHDARFMSQVFMLQYQTSGKSSAEIWGDTLLLVLIIILALVFDVMKEL